LLAQGGAIEHECRLLVLRGVMLISTQRAFSDVRGSGRPLRLKIVTGTFLCCDVSDIRHHVNAAGPRNSQFGRRRRGRSRPDRGFRTPRCEALWCVVGALGLSRRSSLARRTVPFAQSPQSTSPHLRGDAREGDFDRASRSKWRRRSARAL
jgi:hypothetical protein